MSAVSLRTRKELDAAKAELEALRRKNLALGQRNQQLRSDVARLEHETRLAYLEGLDQGRAEGYEEVI